MGASGNTTSAMGGVRSGRRRVRLPSGRALIGALLVLVAAAGVLMSHRSATQPPVERYLVPSQDLAAGRVISTADLGTVALDLPAGLVALHEDQHADVVGRVLRNDVVALDLLRPGDLYEAGRFGSPGQLEVAVELPPARALLGTIGAGDRVDVLVTDPSTTGTSTLTRATVVAVDGDDLDGIGGASTTRVRLAVPDGTTAEALVDAAVRAELTFALPGPADGPRVP